MAVEMQTDGNDLQEMIKAVFENITRVIRGKDKPVRLSLVALLAGGHLLLEDIPGVGKTMLALALAKSIRCPFKRIQFTNDTLPADILGVTIYSRKEERFRFIPGPIFAGVVLADEINRTSPKTQSALLEAMNERKVSIENKVHTLPEPFLVIATQNPIEFHGTFPLPESQLDRFLLRTHMGYPSMNAEKEILTLDLGPEAVNELSEIIGPDEVKAMRDEVRRVRVDDSLLDYILELAKATRTEKRLSLGVSPRGVLMLKKAAQALAFLLGRNYCIPDDLKALVVPVWSHRIVSSDHHPRSLSTRGEMEDILADILERVPVPV